MEQRPFYILSSHMDCCAIQLNLKSLGDLRVYYRHDLIYEVLELVKVGALISDLRLKVPVSSQIYSDGFHPLATKKLGRILDCFRICSEESTRFSSVKVRSYTLLQFFYYLRTFSL